MPGARSRRRTSRGGRLVQGVSRRRPVQRVVRWPPRYAKRTFPECPSGLHTRRSEHGCAAELPRLPTANRRRGGFLHREHTSSQGTGDTRSRLQVLAPRLLGGAPRALATASRSRRAGASRRDELLPPRPAGPARKHRVARASNQSVFLAYLMPANVLALHRRPAQPAVRCKGVVRRLLGTRSPLPLDKQAPSSAGCDPTSAGIHRPLNVYFMVARHLVCR